MSSTIETLQDRVGKCGYDDTQSGEPCKQPATYVDDRCAWHTEVDDRKDACGPTKKVGFQLPGETHARLLGAKRADETLASVIERGLDALERESRLPDAVTEAMQE